MWYLRSLESAGVIQKADNTGMQNWSSIDQCSCTSIWDLKYTFFPKEYIYLIAKEYKFKSPTKMFCNTNKVTDYSIVIK